MKTINAVIFSIAIIIFAAIAGYYYQSRSRVSKTVSVTGLGQTDFVSDLIVWSGSFGESAPTLQEAYKLLEKDRKTVKNYLISKGLSDSEIVFEAVSSSKIYNDKYNESGKYTGQIFAGYNLDQTVVISSNKVDLVEKISREITELINQGINFSSDSPSYYYTKLSELKLELIKKASEDARQRAENIISSSGSKLGKIVYGSMGIFQIVGQNSNEDYSWGGTFNTSSKYKTASITVHQEYLIK